MRTHSAARLFCGLIVAMGTMGMAASAEAQEKKIKIGVIYDLTGPLAGGGSEPARRSRTSSVVEPGYGTRPVSSS